ncbi:RNA pseudouridine synthase 4, mitochondrial-like isoform X2 [Ananas comosus]|uniref:RNA pseudouridine synthase 4, mitochondrial-like isoform X2 n=1 Tax=Ananas comosus TaxID=4615 RepID=A0A6P5G3M5_ANACO|nr:RNA pseudouridine synthase 4, mitochondrial-like isoform X2 [Ananas comosus]
MAADLLPLSSPRRVLLQARLYLYRRSLSTNLASPPDDSPTKDEEEIKEGRGVEKGRWLALPPFAAPPVDPSSLAKKMMFCGGGYPAGCSGDDYTTTALKWVRRCCPDLPATLVHKLFRLRQEVMCIHRHVSVPRVGAEAYLCSTVPGRQQHAPVPRHFNSCFHESWHHKVRKNVASSTISYMDSHAEKMQSKRVSAKNAMMPGDVILLPATVQKSIVGKFDDASGEDDMKYMRSIELYRDTTIIVLNKPPSMPVQGGIGIKYSIDALASISLKYEYAESPRLVHRLDRDSSGVLVLARNQFCASILHSLFREKTTGASFNDIKSASRVLQRKYLALVIGIPRHSKGLISAPLAKVIQEDGKAERITIADDMKSASAQHALTEYKVIESFPHGYTWLELCPLTGRKHQLRVHCAEVLRTPIVGDYKYGWKSHRRWKPVPFPPTIDVEKFPRNKLPFGLKSGGGSIAEKQPWLHLHCKQMTLPNISAALEHPQSLNDDDRHLSKLEKLSFVAPLPTHMQQSWDILSS